MFIPLNASDVDKIGCFGFGLPPFDGVRQVYLMTAPDCCFYLNQAYISMFIAGLKKGKTNRSQTATDVAMVIKESLGSWSHMWSLSNVSGCGSTSLFGSHAGTHQGK